MPFSSDVGAYNDQGRTTLKHGEDGFIYFTVGSLNSLLRVDPETGHYEPVIRFENDPWGAGKFTLVGDSIYFSGNTYLRKMTGFLINRK